MAGHKATVGNVELISLFDGHGDMDPLQVFPASSLDVWQNEYSEFLDDNNHIHPRFGPTAVRSRGKLIVVDTGLQAPGGPFLDDMKAKGIDREAVDLVVITHLHPDHVGWNLRKENGRYLPVFPKARYIASAIDWDFFRNEPEAAERYYYRPEPVEPLESLGLMDLIDGEYHFTEEITAIHTPGHTPGHMSILISSQGEKGIILGDVAHNPLQVHETGWKVSADVDHDQARMTRESIMKRIEAEGLKMAAGHFPAPGFGKVIRLEGKRYWKAL